VRWSSTAPQTPRGASTAAMIARVKVARTPYPKAPGIVAQQRGESQAAIPVESATWTSAGRTETKPRYPHDGLGARGTRYTCRLRVGDVKWRLGDGYLIHLPGRR
jgi:hypothetical protein